MDPVPVPGIPALTPSGAGQPPSLSLAKLPDRFIAYLVDTVPFGVGFYASLIVLVVQRPVLPNEPSTYRKVALAWIALYVLYHAVSNALGATVGKFVLGLRVADAEGRRLGVGGAFLRAAGMLVSTPLFNLGFLWALFQSESRTWHDLLAGSLVVEARPKSSGEALLGFSLAATFLAAILGGNYYFYVVRPTPYDLDAIGKARQGLAVLAAIEETVKAESGSYTADLRDLARASGDVGQFKDAMRELFDPRGLRIQADRDHYRLSGRARDRKRTVVVLDGPAAHP